MTDKELLELAAKAACIEYGWQHIYDDYEGSTSEKWDWNPLTDDGDALRLAVKLLLTTGYDEVIEASWVRKNGVFKGKYEALEFWSNNMFDPYAATRRAIARASAAIGENLG